MMQSMTALFTQAQLFYIPSVAIKLLLLFSAPHTFFTLCWEHFAPETHTTQDWEQTHFHLCICWRLLFLRVVQSQRRKKKNLSTYDQHSIPSKNWRPNVQILTHKNTKNFVKAQGNKSSHSASSLFSHLQTEQTRLLLAFFFFFDYLTNFSLYGRDSYCYSCWGLSSHKTPSRMSNSLIFPLWYSARVEGKPLTLEYWDREFQLCPCSRQRPTVESHQIGLHKSSFLRFNRNSNELISFVMDFWVNFQGREGGYSYSKRRSRYILAILFLVIFLTAVLWKAHKQKQRETSMKYCPLYNIKSCNEEEWKPQYLSTLPLLLSPRRLEGKVHKMLRKTK